MLTAVFTLISIVPVLITGLWVERTAYERELSSVEKMHLLLAQNITNALELFTHDAKSLFHYLTETDGEDHWHEGTAALADTLHFRNFAIFGPNGALHKSLYPRRADNSILPTAGLGAFGALIAEKDQVFSGVMADGDGRPRPPLGRARYLRRCSDGRLYRQTTGPDHLWRTRPRGHC